MANTIHVKLTEAHKDAILVDYDENHIVPKRQSKEGADLSEEENTIRITGSGVFEVAENKFILHKIHEGVLEKVTATEAKQIEGEEKGKKQSEK